MSKTAVPFFRTPFNHDAVEFSDSCAVKEFGPSLTVQSMTEDADINVIMRRYGITGKMPEDVRPVFYGDFDEVFDFRTAQQALRSAQESFDAMPADLRDRFANDPQRFLEFCSAVDEDGKLTNLEELRKMGLAIPKEVEKHGSGSESNVGAAGGGGAVVASGDGRQGGPGSAGEGAPGPGAGRPGDRGEPGQDVRRPPGGGS